MNRRTVLVFILALLVVASSLTTAFSADPSPHKRLKRDCEVCHTTASFRDVQFDHATTDFPLENRHQLEGCRTCHNLEDFSGTSSECSACHTDVHESRLGFDCNRCHQSRGWSVFDVETIHLETNFPILGRHAMVDCQSCHQGMPQSDMSFNTTRCVGCHQSEYLSVSSPNHVTAGFSTECMDCHQMNGWKPAMMDNHDVFFPIFSGEHRGSWNDCSTCHTQDNTFQVFTCLVCHEHAQTKMDGGHQGILGYAYSSPDCYFCHPSGKAGEFTDHDAQFFPIFSGAHQSAWADCSVCHPNPTNRRDIDCLNCHQHSQLVMDGAHGSMAGYSYTSTACLSCHPSSERGSFLAHDGEFFPIFSGTHQGSWADCTACHSLATDRGTFDCLNCHTDSKTTPNHQGIAGYAFNSADCYFCHPTGQRGSYVDHDAQSFPIFSGTHNGQWNDCTACHPDPANRLNVDCLTCHQHDQQTMNGVHGSMAGYSYVSATCLSCHPTGERGSFVGHDGQFFPIFSGTHNGQWNDCSACHTVAGDRTTFDCLACHPSTKTDPVHQGFPGYSHASDACFGCHPTGQAGRFTEHDPLYFKIYSGKHNGKWTDCTTCHTNPSDRSQFNCFTCHEHNKSKMDDTHSGESGYQYDSRACLNCHPRV